MINKSLKVFLFAASAVLAGCGGGSGDGNTNAVVGVPTGSVPVVGLPTGEVPAGGAGGTFELRISDAVLAKNTQRWNDYMFLQLSAALAPLNRIGLIDQTVPVTYDECGRINAFYNSLDKSITICDELVESIHDFHSGRQGADRPAQTANAIVFILYHEIGHALVDLNNIPVLGNDESAADGIAAVLAAETGRSFASVIAGIYLSEEPTSFGDEHTNGEDRFGDITCWAIGSDSSLIFNNSLQSFITLFSESNRDCIAEFGQRRESTLASLPQLVNITLLQSSNPEVIAADDPNPPKLDQTDSSDLAGLVITSGGDFWRCGRSQDSISIGYRFFESGAAQFQLLDGESDLLNITYFVTGGASPSLTLLFDEPEVLSNFQFATQNDAFTVDSSVDGSLSCEYIAAAASA